MRIGPVRALGWPSRPDRAAGSRSDKRPRHPGPAIPGKWTARCDLQADPIAPRAGISEFEEEFLAYVVDPGSRQTIAELLRPQLAERCLRKQSRQLPPVPESLPCAEPSSLQRSSSCS